MEKLDMKSMDRIKENIRKLATIFPECITEAKKSNGGGILKEAVDFDAFKSLFSDVIVEGNTERYQFTWPDKRKAKALVNQEVTSTLRPCREESVNFDTTENLYIEGDNLEVLKLLQETYLGKIKMIYIDPPYNTGHDFVYEDDFSQNINDYISNSGQYDNQGNKLVENTESNGRFHTDWLNMMYPRLKLAKDLLSEDGVIFISIDDVEVNNLKSICDEIFGNSNFIGQMVRVSSPTQNTAKYISIMHDYTLIYVRDIAANEGGWQVKKNYIDEFSKRAKDLFNSGLSEAEISNQLRALTKYPKYYDFDHYTMFDSKGVFRLVSMGGVEKGNTQSQLIHPVTGKPCKQPQGGWRYKEETLKELLKNNEIYFGKDENFVPNKKIYLNEYTTQIPKGITFFDSQSDVKFLNTNSLPFGFPKPLNFIRYLIEMVNLKKTDIVLDFFSGSATTAHAVMKFNAEDGGHRKFIMIQLPENCDEKSEAYKAGYKNICEIGKERIRRAGNQIIEEIKSKNGELFVEESTLDIGFRDLKLDSSNMNDVYYTPDETDQRMLDGFVSNIKKDRTAEDLFFQVMLDLGVLLSAKIVEEDIGGKKVFNVDNNYLIACFDEDVDENVIIEVAKKKPTYFVMRDSSLANDSVSVNFDQIFARYSPDTVRKVL